MIPKITSTKQLLNYADFRKYSNSFKETGSAAGDGIQRAIDAGFARVDSCEASHQWFDVCTKRFAGNPMIRVFFGKSTDVLHMMLTTFGHINTVECISPDVIFLDAHPAGPASAGHKEWEAGDRSWDQDAIIKSELAIILATAQKHVIIIDDVNGFNDGHAIEYVELIETKWPGAYEYAFYDECLSGDKDFYYHDKVLVATPKQM